LLLNPQLLLQAIAFGVLDVAMGAYTIAAGIATAVTTALGLAVELLLGPIGLIILAAALLFAAWQTNFLGIRDLVGGVIGFIVGKFQDLLPWLEIVGKALSAVLGFVGDVIGAVGGAIDHALNDANRAADKAASDTTR